MTLGDSEGHFGDLHTVAILCAQLTRDLLAIAKLLWRKEVGAASSSDGASWL